jgi:predicted MFS family arabinose efflux permease
MRILDRCVKFDYAVKHDEIYLEGLPMSAVENKGVATRAIFAGLCASLVGIGLARFGYTPLVPSLIEAHWFAAKDVIYLGAANLVGYLIGAVIGRPVGRRFTARVTLQAMMLLTSAAFFACGFAISLSWFFVWRLLSGVSGGIIMVLVAATVLPHVPVSRRGMASGAIFLGVGIGIAASGTVVPLLLDMGLRETWLGLGVLSLVLSAASWACWPRAEHHHAATAAATPAVPKPGTRLELNLLYVQYALMAFGLVPLMMFLVDYVARGLGWGTHTAALFWIIYGVGAIAGPVVFGTLSDRLGWAAANRFAMWLQVAVVAVMILSTNHLVLMVMTLVIGSFPPSIVPITLNRVHHILPGDAHGQSAIWSKATTLFALFQAVAGYGYSYLFARSGGDYHLLMGLGAAALLVALFAEGIKKLLAKPVNALL